MLLNLVAKIELPPHEGPGGFDHGDVHGPGALLCVAHTANNTVDMVDLRQRTVRKSIPRLPGVAGVLFCRRTAAQSAAMFSSNRAEGTISMFSPAPGREMWRVRTGLFPNGMAVDDAGAQLLVAHVGAADKPGSQTVCLVDVSRGVVEATLPAPGRTRWAVYHAAEKQFLINIADPPQIMRVDPLGRAILSPIEIPAAGPHGLEIDHKTGRVFCACDDGSLLALDAQTGKLLSRCALSGAPDVIMLNRRNNHLYVACGDPGAVDIVDANTCQLIGSVSTEPGAHTLAVYEEASEVIVFLPQSCVAAVYRDDAA